MSLFVDGLLLQLSDPTQLTQLLAPASDTNNTRLLTLLKIMYDLQYITIHSVQDIKITIEAQRLLLTTHQTSGMWRPATPDNSHTDVTYEGSDKLEPIWLDICAVVKLSLLMEVNSGKIESIDTHQVDYIDTHYLEHVMIQLQKTGPFDAQDPANIQSYTLNVAVFIRDSLDVAATLRSVKLARAIMKRVTIYQKELNSVEVLTPYAPIVIFPQSVLASLPFTQAALEKLFAQEGVMILFMTFP